MRGICVKYFNALNTKCGTINIFCRRKKENAFSGFFSIKDVPNLRGGITRSLATFFKIFLNNESRYRHLPCSHRHSCNLLVHFPQTVNKTHKKELQASFVFSSASRYRVPTHPKGITNIHSL